MVPLAVVAGPFAQIGDQTAELELMRFLFYRYLRSDAGPTVLLLDLDEGGSLSILFDLPLCTVQRSRPLLTDPDPTVLLPHGVERQRGKGRGQIGRVHIARVPVSPGPKIIQVMVARTVDRPHVHRAF